MPKVARATTALLAMVAGAQWADASALSLNLSTALADTKAKLAANQQADILVFGDSLSFGWEVTTYLTYFRKHLQSQYGNAGHGYQAASLWSGAGFNSDWSGPTLSTDPAPHRAIDGLWESYQPVNGGPNQAYLVPRSPTTDLHYMVQPGGGAFEIRRGYDGALVTTVNTESATHDVASYTLQLQPGETAYTVQPVGGKPFTLLGQNTYTDTPGVRVHRAANGGYGLDNYLQRDWTMDRQLGLINPDLVMVWLGQNDFEFTRESYRDGLRQFIDRVHDTLPNAEVVLVGTHQTQANWLPDLVAAMEDVAAQDGVGFVNMYEAAGSYQFLIESAFLSDGVHFSNSGARYMGRVLYDAFVTNGESLPTAQSVHWQVEPNAPRSGDFNWRLVGAGNAIDSVADFGPHINMPPLVLVNGPRKIGILNLNRQGSLQIAGSGTIAMHSSSGESAINVTRGSHTIGAPLVLESDLVITSARSTGVALTGELTATGRRITKTGAGTAQFANVRAASLDVTQGVASIRARKINNDPSGTSVVAALNVGKLGALDLANNSMVIDYTGPVGTLLDDTRQSLKDGRLITSVGVEGTMGLGYGDNSILGQSVFAGQAVDVDSVLVRFTYFGDADLDGDVDVADLGMLATNWQSAGAWTAGDFDYTGVVDAADLGLLASNWEGPMVGPGGFFDALASFGLPASAVPEPVSASLFGLLIPCLLKRRGRRGSR